MKKYIQAFIIFAFTIFYLPAMAEQARQLSWEDLVPAKLLADDPLAKLTPDQQDMVYWVVNMLETLPKREADTEEYYKEVDAAFPTLKKSGIDIKKVLAIRKKIRTSIVEELNGQLVRIPGYLLPLEISGAKITEFLLVPYVGACIHVPPPPPNQIIYVKAKKNDGYNSKKIFEPVWVTGVISAKSMVKDLFLVDGSAGINIGYTMQADHIEPYEK
jgi:hypothetical protein